MDILFNQEQFDRDLRHYENIEEQYEEQKGKDQDAEQLKLELE